MLARKYNSETDYPTLEQYWSIHGWNAVNKRVLGTRGVVITSDDGETIHSAGFLYLDGEISMMEWIVSNPDNTPRQSLKSIKMLVNKLRAIAIENNANIIFTSVKQQSLANLYNKCGFIETDNNMKSMISILK